MNGMHLALLDLLLFTLECVFVSVRVCVCVYILVHDFLFFLGMNVVLHVLQYYYNFRRQQILQIIALLYN